MTDFVLFSFFVTFATCFLLAIFLIFSDRKYSSFAMFNINLCVWSFSYGLHLISKSEERALLYSKVTLASLVLIPYLFFKTARFLTRFEISRPCQMVENTLVAILVILMFTPIMVEGVSPFLEFNFAPNITPLWYIFFIYMVSVVLFSFVIIYKSIKNYYKNKLIFYGFAIGWAGGFTTCFPYFEIELYPFATILIAMYCIVITYSMVIHRISDIFIFSKVFIKVFSFLILFLSYVVLSEVYTRLGNVDNTILISLLTIIYFFISLELYHILTKGFKSLGINFGFGVRYDKKNIMKKINNEVLDVVSIDILLSKIKSIIGGDMQVEIKSFYISDDLGIFANKDNLGFSRYFGEDIAFKTLKKLTKEFNSNKILLSIKLNEAYEKLKLIMTDGEFEGYIPLTFHNKKMGFITLKSRPNKSNYFYYEDMEVFDDLVIKVGIALERVRLHLHFLREKESALIALAGSIAHELRNPLGAIRLTTENLVSIKDNISHDPNLQKIVYRDSKFKEIIDESSIKIANFKGQINKTIDLASNIIDITLHELGGKKFTREDFGYYSAKQLILDTASLYGYKNNEEKEKIIINLYDDRSVTAGQSDLESISVKNIDNENDFIIFANDTGFKYIIFNLVKNALFYLDQYPSSNITISFEKEKTFNKKLLKKFNVSDSVRDAGIELEVGKYNVVSVTDTGPGIKEEVITKIFQSYFTLDKKGGTGVGLDFCNRMMNNFGGAIICESKIDEFTKFSLLFPILSDNEKREGVNKILDFEDKIKKSNKSEEGAYELERSLSKNPKKNILLVDDIRTNIEILARDLRNKCPNFNITIIIYPIEAFELIKSKEECGDQFDLILTDIEMPLMGGVELTRKIRNDLGISKDALPILAYSSREDKDIANQAITAGCNAYYIKPKDLRFIARNISKWVLNYYIPSKSIDRQDIVVNNTTLKGLNVIVADDQAINLFLIAKKVSNAGANVFQCSDGKDIIKLFQLDPTKYHLIITDINMGKVGGIDAAKEVRKIESNYNDKNDASCKVPIIALSGDGDKKFVMSLLNSGIDDYMLKGSNPKDLIRLSKFWVDYRFSIDILSQSGKNKSNSSNNDVLEGDFTSLFSNKSEATEIADVFESDGKNIIEEIKNDKSKVNDLQKSIHKLKGSSRAIRSSKLFKYLSEINDLARNNKLPDDNNFDKKIEELFKKEVEFLRLEIEKKF